MPNAPLTVRTACIVCVVAGVVVSAAAVPAAAQSRHRARLSRDMEDRIQHRIESPAYVSVSAADATIDQLAARYGARVKKRLQNGGAVLEATGGQIDAIAQDPDVDHLSGNPIVHRMMATTTTATGADQVWAGL